MEDIKGKETENLKFEFLGYSPSGKTKLFYVKSKERLETLGMIYWRPTWRRYVITTLSEIDFDKNCLDQISGFLKDLMEERKLQREKEKENI